MRVGLGYDIHRLVEGKRLVLGGVEVPYEVGLEGFSDADVVIHAVCDAVLGAAALGDIGEHFPEGDARFRGIDSAELLKQVVEMAEGKGFRVASADVVIYAERPRLGDVKGEIRENLARLLSIDAGGVGVKAKTFEGLGPIGEGKAIAAHAVVCLEERAR